MILASSELSSAIAADIDFRRDIQPLLNDRCIKCHGSEKQKGGLRLDVRSSMLTGGDSGEPAVVPGHADKSTLLQRITSRDEQERMPPDGEPLSKAQVKLLRRWIDAGAEPPDGAEPSAKKSAPEMVVTDEDRQHWSFLPLSRIVPPTVSDPSWVRTPVDQFILRAHEEAGLRPASPLDARRLIRRMYFDLIGLPPIFKQTGDRLTEERLGIEIDLDDFEKSTSAADAVAHIVDKLLSSPHYGERWARHWLDIARYADSNGQEGDGDRPNAYRYRDFVIRALNEDLAYDTFVRWQLAGDEIEPENPQAIAATGFLVAGFSTKLKVPMEEEKLRNRANELDDMVSTTGQALLGLTLACARCHDHKYDPLPTRDYYQMMAAFNSGDRADVALADPQDAKANFALHEEWQKRYDAAAGKRDEWLKQARKPVVDEILRTKISKLDISDDEKQLLLDKAKAADPHTKMLTKRFKQELAIADREIVAALSTEQQEEWKKLDRKVQAINAQKPVELPKAFAFADAVSEPRETWLFERGDFLSRNQQVKLGFLTVLSKSKTAEDYWTEAKQSRLRDDTTQQRRAMANWMTDVDNGAGVLLARVMVNRVWQHHFGEGLVRTVSDFGTRGEAPSHPDLLEWLTGEFIRSGWSVKHLHRLMVNSATYQQGNSVNEAFTKIDPENRLLWHRGLQRLEAESLRDSMLAVAGTLNPAIFGESFKPPIAAEAMQARNVQQPYPRDAKDTPATRRRTVYMFHKRVVQYPLLQAFDAPDAQVSCGRRNNTTVAPQSLAMLNDPFVRLRATEFAARISRQAGDNTDPQVRHAFESALSRTATLDEIAEVTEFIEQQTSARQKRDNKLKLETARQLALADFCQMLFASNEFIYID